MILRALRVSAFRCLAEEVALGPFDDRLNVLHAPNGVGKSTLFEALQRGLFEDPRSNAQELRELRPWGRELSPSVTVEFSHAGEILRVSKVFLGKRACLLERLEGGRFVPLAEDQAAVQQVRELLSRDKPGKGAVKQEHWGLCQVLWAPQGERDLPGLCADVVAKVRGALGAETAPRVAHPLAGRVREEFLRHYQPKKRELRADSEAALRREELRAIGAEVTAARAAQAALEAGLERLEALGGQQAQARARAVELERQLGILRQRAEEHRRLAAELARLQEQARAAESEHDCLARAVADLVALTDRQAKAVAVLIACDRAAQELARVRQVACAAEDEARAALERLRAEEDEVVRVGEEARRATRYLEARGQAERLAALVREVDAAHARLESALQTEAALVAPDRATLKKLRKAAAAREDAARRLDAALVTVELVPARELEVEVRVGEQAGRRLSVPAGTALAVRGDGGVELAIAGVGQIRARGPAGDAAELEASLAKAEEVLRAQTERFGCDDMDELECRSEEKQERGRAADKAREELERLLEGSTREERGAELAEAQALRAAHEAQQPGWADAPPAADEIQVAADTRARAHREARQTAERALEVASTARLQAEQALAQAAADRKLAEREAREAEVRLRELREDGRTDEARRLEMLRRHTEREAAREAARQAESTLAALGGDPAAELTRLAREREAAGEAVAQASRDEAAQRGRLAELGAKAPHAWLVRAEAARVELEERCSLAVRRAEAARLLFETLEAVEREAMAAVAGPLERETALLLRRMGAGSLGAVRVGEGLAPEGVAPPALREGDPLVGPVCLSGGEQEQLQLATRLALAMVLAREERQLLVLDDALMATDDLRFRRILGLLEEAADRLQFVLLTCHPERYRGLAGAVFHDLEANLRAPQCAPAPRLEG